MNGDKFDPLKMAPGTKVGPYEVVQLEAEGGYGFLYRVRRDGKTYALKIARCDLAGQYPDFREQDEERQDREIAAMKTLRHPNIVRVLAFDRWPDLEGGYPYFVMEFVEGDRLDEWQVDNAPALDRIVAMYEKISFAVEYMHTHGVFHRDLKAENVIVRSDNEPVVLDFGLARPQHAHEVTRAGVIGTVSHFAPEYVRWCDSAASVTEPFVWQVATDLHSLGYMLYEALTGRSPFAAATRSKSGGDTELLLAIKKIVPKRPSTLNPKTPAVLDDLVMQLLAKEPEQRPKSAGAVAEALRQAREAAQASGDRTWTDPFDLPASSAAAPAGQAPGGGDVAPDDPGGDAAARPAGGPTDAAPASIHVDVIEEGDVAAGPVSLPSQDQAAEFNEEGPGAAPAAAAAKPDPLAETIAAVKAQVEASAPRKRGPPLLVGGLAVVATLLVILVVGGRRPPAKDGPKTLLSKSEAGGLASVSPALPFALPPPTSGRADPTAEAATKPASPAVGPGSSRPPGEVLDADLARRTARAIDLPSERIEPAYAPVPRPAVFQPERSPLVVSRPISEDDGVLQRSRRMDVAAAPPPGPPKPRGVPYGSHIRARLLSNLDTRTIGSGPVEAILDVPHIVRGEIVLPVRTLVYGTATETAGRFTVRFTRLRLPDDTELAFEALALARDDGKPGLAASRRTERPPEQREGVASRIAKGTGNILLDTITGGTPATVARNAGQAVLNQEASQPASTSNSQWALLLDAGVVFDLWVEHSF
jgi:eukaryotic-like serine/threonine-protein kinase